MKVLAFCDSPTLPSGFGCVARNLFSHWHAAGVELHVWAIGFEGFNYDRFPYKLIPAGGGGEWFQPARLAAFLNLLAHGGYTHVWIMQDTFALSTGDFPARLREICNSNGIRSLMYFPVDAPQEPEWMAILAAVAVPVAYTQHGKLEAETRVRQINLEIECAVAPHGVDTEVFHPLPDGPRGRPPRNLWTPQWVQPDDFLMINVNTNQRRKDVTRSLEILAELRRRGVPAKLLMHMSAVGNKGNLELVGKQLGLRNLREWSHHGKYFQNGWYGTVSEADLTRFYNAADLYLTTSLGEGWGLGMTEALACGTMVAAPAHTACREIKSCVNSLEKWAERDTTALPRPRMILLPLEKHGQVLEDDNSRVRFRVDVDGAATEIEKLYHSGAWKVRAGLSNATKEWLSWPRIAAQMLQLLGGDEMPELKPRVESAPACKHLHAEFPEPRPERGDLSKWKCCDCGQRFPFHHYLEFGGGLGDVFNQMYHRGQYNVLRDLQPGEYARVALICHNPGAVELFKHHPKRDQFMVMDAGYWHGQHEDAAGRHKWQLPPPGITSLPEKDREIEFPVSVEEWGRLSSQSLDWPNKLWVIVAATAGLSERSFPPAIFDRCITSLLDAGYLPIIVGRNYDRHGRVEIRMRHDGVIDLVDQLSVPATARLLQLSAGLVTCHSALNLLGWHLSVPQLLLYPHSVYRRHIQKPDQWAFGIDSPLTVHAEFDKYTVAHFERFTTILQAQADIQRGRQQIMEAASKP